MLFRFDKTARGAAGDVALFLLLMLLVFVVAFWRLGEASFWDPDEAHYAETSREMIATGDWWAPYYNGEPFFDKPILFHQLQALAMLVFGPSEFAARIVSSLAAVALIVATIWFGAASSSRSVGLAAGLFLAVSPGIFGLSRYAILDQLFTAFLFAGASFLAIAAVNGRPRLQWYGYVAIALAVLTKGPLALVLIALTLLVASACSREARRRLWGLHWMWGLAVIVTIALPWFVYMYQRFGEPFFDGYVLDENLRLYVTRRFGRQPSMSFYLRLLALGLLPWTGLVLGRAVDCVRALIRKDQIDTSEVLLWSWTAAVVGFFTLSQFKLDHYVWPAAPALYLICARAWNDVRRGPFESRHRGSRAGLLLVGPLLVVLGLGAGYFIAVRLELPRASIFVPLALTGAGGVLSAQVAVAMRRRRVWPGPWVALAALAVTYAGLIAIVLPRLEEGKVVPDLARWVAAQAEADDAVCAYKFSRWKPVFRFYVDRSVTFVDEAGEAERFFDKARRPLCVMRSQAYDELATAGIPLTVVHEREGMWVTSGRTLWWRHVARDTFVVVADARQGHRTHAGREAGAVSRELSRGPRHGGVP